MTIDELRQNAILFWPPALRAEVAELSILPHLLQTQELFISTLNLAGKSPVAWKSILEASGQLSANLFLKHLMVLSDLGRETLSKIVPLTEYFSNGTMRYTWREAEYTYSFQHFNKSAKDAPLTNRILRLDNPDLVKGNPLTPAMEDVIMLLLHGATCIDDTLPDGYRERCQIGQLIGEPDALKKFVQGNYLRVSTQIRGQAANSSGQVAQRFVKKILRDQLTVPGWQVKSGHIPGISHNEGDTLTSFDIVAVSPSGRFFAVEVAFQETTNSVIERKAGQALARRDMLHKADHKMCYVIDGAGNLNFRKRAVSLIMNYSDCTVAFTEAEIARLARYMESVENAVGAA